MGASTVAGAAVPAPHPARYNPTILDRFAALVADLYPDQAVTILDPFAGTGRIHELPYDTVGVELEPEWGSRLPPDAQGTSLAVVGDAQHLPFPDATFHVVATSPTYGNRMADHHTARDDSRRHTYTHTLGRQLTDGNSGQLQWGDAYRELHAATWAETYRVLRPGGWLLLNIKDHIRNGEHQPVSHWHTSTLVELGFTFDAQRSTGVTTRHLGHGTNNERRAGQELVLTFHKPGATP